MRLKAQLCHVLAANLSQLTLSVPSFLFCKRGTTLYLPPRYCEGRCVSMQAEHHTHRKHVVMPLVGLMDPKDQC